MFVWGDMLVCVCVCVFGGGGASAAECALARCSIARQCCCGGSHFDGPAPCRLCKQGYNTDWSAAISAIEHGLDPSYVPSRSSSSSAGAGAAQQRQQRSPLAGRTVVVVGAGGAGRALAFGAAARGAHVVVANRNVARAEELAAALDPGAVAKACSLEALASGFVVGDVLVNTTSVGMHPHVSFEGEGPLCCWARSHSAVFACCQSCTAKWRAGCEPLLPTAAPQENETPVPAAALHSYTLVFDAVYTPLHTRLLREAAKAGCRCAGCRRRRELSRARVQDGRHLPRARVEGRPHHCHVPLARHAGL